MENDKSTPAAAAGKPTAANPSEAETAPAPAPVASPRRPSRTPFTTLSQVDADLALARALQEQERAYMLLRMNGNGGGGSDDYASSDSGSWVEEGELEADADADADAELDAGADADAVLDGAEHEDEDDDEDEDGEGDEDDEDEDEDEEDGEGSDYGEDAFDAMDQGLDPADFESDEAYARALQEAEGNDLAARLMALAGLNGWGAAIHGNHGGIDQDAWEDVDPDELSYEELIALGEVVGTENRGLSTDSIASLPSVKYKAQSVQDGNTDQCVICRLEYEDGESLVVLPCKHTYHPECINKWLQINKVCPVCSAEVSTSTSSN